MSCLNILFLDSMILRLKKVFGTVFLMTNFFKEKSNVKSCGEVTSCNCLLTVRQSLMVKTFETSSVYFNTFILDVDRKQPNWSPYKTVMWHSFHVHGFSIEIQRHV